MNVDPFEILQQGDEYLWKDEPDFVKAKECYTKAAAFGSAQARFNLGICCASGFGSDKPDLDEAWHHFQQAASMRFAPALYIMGRMIELGQSPTPHGSSFQDALSFYMQSAKLGYTRAMIRLSELYLANDLLPPGTSASDFKDKEARTAASQLEAAKWVRTAANAGDSLAQYLLARIYFKGEGFGRSPSEAAIWLRKSALNGFKRAQWELGRLYGSGEGMEEDMTEAIKWITKAAAEPDGIPEAIQFLKEVEEQQQKCLRSPRSTKKEPVPPPKKESAEGRALRSLQ